MSLKVLIVDDEPIARKVIREYLEDIDYLELVATAENPLKADVILQEQTIDLLFLDINMPRLSGIEFLRASAGRLHLPMVIITTAYAQYALDGFEWDVVDYLVKPFSFERFLKACNRVRDRYTLEQGRDRQVPAQGKDRQGAAQAADREEPAGPGSAGPFSAGHFFVKCDNRLEKVLYDELVYVEAMMNYIILHTTTSKLIVYLTMKGMFGQLPPERFIKVHKSFIVNRDMVRSIRGNVLNLGTAEVAVSQHYFEEAMQEILRDRVIKRL
jgi:DNA-binding LytR/AlgR family response regulator